MKQRYLIFLLVTTVFWLKHTVKISHMGNYDF